MDFFPDQCQIIFPGKICLRILAYIWVIFFWISARFFFSDQYFWRFVSISDDFGSGCFSRSVSNNFCRKNISQDFSLLLSYFFLEQFQIFFRINISEDFSLFLTILAVDFSGAALDWFPGLHTSESFFSGSVPDFFSRINISEDFSLLLTILAMDFFPDQRQIIFPGKICLRILAYFWVIFFWISARFFFSDQYFWRFVSISDDFGSGCFSRSVSNNFCRKNISQDFSLLLSYFFLEQFQIFFRINISEDFSLFLTILAVDFSGAALDWFPGLHTSEWIFSGLVLDCVHTRNLSEDFGSGFFSRVVWGF